LLVDYLNVDALADGLCKLMEDEKLRMRLGENARKSVLRYSEERVMGLWTNLFNSLVR
jgi:glycosyltransferase involved in cell wall biosynthesis